MKLAHLIDVLTFSECILCAVALLMVVLREQLKDFFYLTLFLVVRLAANLLMAYTLLAVPLHPASPVFSYRIFFYEYWVTYALEAALLLMAVHGIYRLAMAPLLGLQRLGMLVFRWAAAVSVAVSAGFAFGPQFTSLRFVIRAVTQLQQTSSILTVCLLLFVCFAVKPMGLSYRSRVFGATLGLGILATSNLLASAWIASTKNMYSDLSLVNGFAICAALGTWTVYFYLPEPKRRMIVLPTTSPFLRWNQIAQALGDEPGFVAVAGIPPEMFAEAEIEVMKRASRKMMDIANVA